MEISQPELQELLKEIESSGLSVSQVIDWLKRSHQRARAKVSNLNDEFILSVDYSKTFLELKAAGRYELENSEITEENFPIPTALVGKKIEVTGKLFSFEWPIDGCITNGEVNQKLADQGYRRPNIAELFALGEAHPKLQNQVPILGARSEIFSKVPFLGMDGKKRKIALYKFSQAYGGARRCRFLAIKLTENIR